MRNEEAKKKCTNYIIAYSKQSIDTHTQNKAEKIYRLYGKIF